MGTKLRKRQDRWDSERLSYTGSSSSHFSDKEMAVIGNREPRVYQLPFENL